MDKLTSLQDLTRVREAARRDIRIRAELGTSILIGMGTCGIAAGARDVLTAIQRELGKRRITAHLGTVGCIGMCVKEPLVDIQQAGKPHVLYANVQPEMVPRLIEQHLVKGLPVTEWVVGRMQTE
jgi:NADP-reducing hydrogenase subunit HndB